MYVSIPICKYEKRLLESLHCELLLIESSNNGEDDVQQRPLRHDGRTMRKGQDTRGSHQASGKSNRDFHSEDLKERSVVD